MEFTLQSIFFRPSFSDTSLPVSRRSTRPDIIQAKKTPLLVLNLELGRERFHLSRGAKNYLESLQGKCYVISVSGSPMLGKSTLLNLLLSLFDWDALQGEISYQDIYQIGDKIESTTEGIDMYCLTKNGKNFIFLDIEGDNDPDRGETGTWIHTNLIQTAAGISHVHLYNYLNTPQHNFLKYFETITRVVRQNDIHEDFETKFTFLRRDFSDETLLAQALENSSNKIEKVLKPNSIDYSLHFLPEPPQHVTKKKSQTSCIALTGGLCQDCQGHLFTSGVLGIRDELKRRMSQVTPFQNGHHFCRALEQLLEINRREIPFFLDRGCISEIRLKRIEKEQIRISAGLAKVGRYQVQYSLYEEVLRIMNDHPRLTNSQNSENSNESGKLASIQLNLNEIGSLANSQQSENSNEVMTLANNQLIKDFSETGKDLEIKVSQLEYMVGELSRFIDQYLLDEKASILNETEKKALWEAYVGHFDRILKEVLALFKNYSGMIDLVCENLLNIQMHTIANLKEYLAAASETRNRTMTIGVELLSSGLLGFLGREVAGRAIAALFVGGGVVGGVVTAFFFFQAWQRLREAMRKNEETLNLKKIDGIKDVKDAKEEMKKMEEFVTGLINNLKKQQSNSSGDLLRR